MEKVKVKGKVFVEMGFNDEKEHFLFLCYFSEAATIKLIVSHDFDMLKHTLPPGKKNDGPEKTNYKLI